MLLCERRCRRSSDTRDDDPFSESRRCRVDADDAIEYDENDEIIDSLHELSSSSLSGFDNVVDDLDFATLFRNAVTARLNIFLFYFFLYLAIYMDLFVELNEQIFAHKAKICQNEIETWLLFFSKLKKI